MAIRSARRLPDVAHALSNSALVGPQNLNISSKRRLRSSGPAPASAFLNGVNDGVSQGKTGGKPATINVSKRLIWSVRAPLTDRCLRRSARWSGTARVNAWHQHHVDHRRLVDEGWNRRGEGRRAPMAASTRHTASLIREVLAAVDFGSTKRRAYIASPRNALEFDEDGAAGNLRIRCGLQASRWGLTGRWLLHGAQVAAGLDAGNSRWKAGGCAR